MCAAFMWATSSFVLIPAVSSLGLRAAPMHILLSSEWNGGVIRGGAVVLQEPFLCSENCTHVSPVLLYWSRSPIPDVHQF
jgi:hypothetical protein